MPFSPLFIGEVSLTTAAAVALLAVGPFSPLFIGEVSLTRHHGEQQPRLSVFQSPLHRGGLFNGQRVAHHPPRHPFQSPLHRGGLFNAGDHAGAWAIYILSVPSSSGRSL